MPTVTITTQYPLLLQPELFEAYRHGWIDSITIDGKPINLTEFKEAAAICVEIERLIANREYDEATIKTFALRRYQVAQYKCIEFGIELQNQRWEIREGVR